MAKRNSYLQAGAQLADHLYTVFLFMKSDFPLVIVPSLLCGMVLVGPTSISLFTAAWIWQNLHLLAFNIQNQLTGVEEDRLCKPDRPFASGRVSLESGPTLYLVALSASIAWSALHDLLPLSIIYTCGTWSYNELELATNPFLKTPMGGIAYWCYVGGTTYIMGGHQTLSANARYGILISGLIFGLTGHMQDFKDRSGDARMGRRTIPLLLPQRVARWSLLLLISACTYALIVIWSPPFIVSCILTIMSVITVTTLVGTHSEEDDRVNFCWYEVS
ncbi:hypothetical protein AAF712_013827 [Marasmius tenuissimus]|uniref:UbiA prenyltransferase n=1 Tax=Marasmius tenuissimus TaxID=585030 RepID=A0ABR2ZDX1_9AGAR